MSFILIIGLVQVALGAFYLRATYYPDHLCGTGEEISYDDFLVEQCESGKDLEYPGGGAIPDYFVLHGGNCSSTSTEVEYVTCYDELHDIMNTVCPGSCGEPTPAYEKLLGNIDDCLRVNTTTYLYNGWADTAGGWALFEGAHPYQFDGFIKFGCGEEIALGSKIEILMGLIILSIVVLF